MYTHACSAIMMIEWVRQLYLNKNYTLKWLRQSLRKILSTNASQLCQYPYKKRNITERGKEVIRVYTHEAIVPRS